MTVIDVIPKKISHPLFICKAVQVHPHMISPRIHTILKEMYRCVDSPFSIFSHTLETTERTCEYYRALCGRSQIENLERVALKFCWISVAESALLYILITDCLPFK